MRNLKHTIITATAFVMVGTLSFFQVSDMYRSRQERDLKITTAAAADNITIASTENETGAVAVAMTSTEEEIDALIAAKAFEQKIMSLMPACIILYMRVSFHGFIETLYGNLFGVIVMTACLALYAAAFLWGKKIVSIELF